jgi:hypothetical protein
MQQWVYFPDKTDEYGDRRFFFFFSSVDTPATVWPVASASDGHECGAVGGMIGRGNRSTRSSGQSSWLRIQRSGFDSWCYQIF